MISGDTDSPAHCPEPVNLVGLGCGERISSVEDRIRYQRATKGVRMFLRGPLDVRLYAIKINTRLQIVTCLRPANYTIEAFVVASVETITFCGISGGLEEREVIAATSPPVADVPADIPTGPDRRGCWRRSLVDGLSKISR